jgi:predicted RNA-binding Zn-ribbon protein involved in translation (DUF1610 family)
MQRFGSWFDSAMAKRQYRFAKLYHLFMVAYPIKTCVACGEEFELKPGKPGFANRCPSCSEEDAAGSSPSTDGWKTDKQANAARRDAMRNLLYRKDS